MLILNILTPEVTSCWLLWLCISLMQKALFCSKALGLGSVQHVFEIQFRVCAALLWLCISLIDFASSSFISRNYLVHWMTRKEWNSLLLILNFSDNLRYERPMNLLNLESMTRGIAFMLDIQVCHGKFYMDTEQVLDMSNSCSWANAKVSHGHAKVLI